MSDIVKLLERVYQGFILRDLLGFTAPGCISLISVWTIFDLDARINQIVPTAIAGLFGTLSETWKIILFLVLAYLSGWALQTIHYGILNSIERFPFLRRFSKGKYSILANLVSRSDAEGIENFLKASPIVTRSGLELDLILARAMTDELLKERIRELPYTERITVLVIMTSNLAIATALLFVSIILKTNAGLIAWLLFLIPFFLYREYWRLIDARNLLVAIYAVEFQKKAGVQSGSASQSSFNNAT